MGKLKALVVAFLPGFLVMLCGCGAPSVEQVGALAGITEVQVRSAAIDRYFGSYKLIARYPEHGPRQLLVRIAAGEDYRLDGTWSQVSNKDDYYRVRRISAFLEALSIGVGNKSEAISVVQLVEELMVVSMVVEQMGARDDKIRIYDDRGKNRFARGSQWWYSAERGAGVWKVKIDHTGPAVSVSEPVRYEIAVDPESGFFFEIRML